MSKNPLAAKIAAPYARALYDFSVDQNLMHQKYWMSYFARK